MTAEPAPDDDVIAVMDGSGRCWRRTVDSNLLPCWKANDHTVRYEIEALPRPHTRLVPVHRLTEAEAAIARVERVLNESTDATEPWFLVEQIRTALDSER